MSAGVMYYLVAGEGGGRAATHALQFVVALNTLRRHWDGPVHCVAGDEAAASICRHVAREDSAFSWGLHPKPESARCYGMKANARDWSPFQSTIFLDCDTLIVGDFEDLWPLSQSEVVITSFSDWLSSGNRIQSRVAKWKDWFPAEVAAAKKRPIPAINTGVFGFGWESRGFFDRWTQWCNAQPRLFIADETAMQVLAAIHDPRPRIVDDRYNCSPKLGKYKREARIWHGHGSRFFRKEGRALWLPEFKICLENNSFGLADWGMKYFPKLLGVAERGDMDALLAELSGKLHGGDDGSTDD